MNRSIEESGEWGPKKPLRLPGYWYRYEVCTALNIEEHNLCTSVIGPFAQLFSRYSRGGAGLGILHKRQSGD